MPEFFPLLAQAGVVAFQAAWLTVAAFDNFRHGSLTEPDFAHVLRMDLVAKGDSDAYEAVSSRRIENPRTEKRLFQALVGWSVQKRLSRRCCG